MADKLFDYALLGRLVAVTALSRKRLPEIAYAAGRRGKPGSRLAIIPDVRKLFILLALLDRIDGAVELLPRRLGQIRLATAATKHQRDSHPGTACRRSIMQEAQKRFRRERRHCPLVREWLLLSPRSIKDSGCLQVQYLD